jgi:hypothetical protein
VIVLLYGGKEGIHIDMYDLAMAHVARSRKRLLTEKRGIRYREGGKPAKEEEATP